MDGQGSEAGSAIDDPSYFCYKAYIKTVGYAMFSVYSVVGIRRMRENIGEYFLPERCASCRQYVTNNVEMPALFPGFATNFPDYFRDVSSITANYICGNEGWSFWTDWCIFRQMFWGAFDVLMYTLAPLSALVGMIHADLEWLFPAYAIRALFPSFILIGPILFTIFSYIVYWFIDLAIDVQQVSEDLLDIVVWKRCIWASALLLANIYALFLTFVVLQLIYYQHYIVIEEQFIRQQRNAIAGVRVQHHNRRRPVPRGGEAVAAAAPPGNQPVNLANPRNQQQQQQQQHSDGYEDV